MPMRQRLGTVFMAKRQKLKWRNSPDAGKGSANDTLSSNDLNAAGESTAKSLTLITSDQREEIIRRLQKGEELSSEWARVLFPPEKREYELLYYGKAREEDILADTLAVPLQKARTFGPNGTSWHNMLVFGDNLQVMKSLLEMKKSNQLCNADGTSGARLVYIDPPFGTKREFSGNQDQKAYQDKIEGARFIEFLRKRFILIRELLSDNGTLVVHLDLRKGHYCKTVLDEVFSERNFRNEVIWKRTGARSDSTTYNHIHDSLFV